jgi:hypothetical protein
VIHWKARRLLPQVLDGTLAAHVEAEVREHADDCRFCTRTLAEFETCELLLADLPTALVPLDTPAGREERLLALARWVVDPEPTWSERLGMSAIGALGGAFMLAMVLTGQAWAPTDPGPEPSFVVAGVLPIPDVEMVPIGLARWQ